jgi:hypothetical protein
MLLHRTKRAFESAAERRQYVAQGASPGSASARRRQAPEGAKDRSAAVFLSPLRGSLVRDGRSPRAHTPGYILSPHPGLRACMRSPGTVPISLGRRVPPECGNGKGTGRARRNGDCPPLRWLLIHALRDSLIQAWRKSADAQGVGWVILPLQRRVHPPVTSADQSAYALDRHAGPFVAGGSTLDTRRTLRVQGRRGRVACQGSTCARATERATLHCLTIGLTEPSCILLRRAGLGALNPEL